VPRAAATDSIEDERAGALLLAQPRRPRPLMSNAAAKSARVIERPAMQRLLSDIKSGKVQIIVVYKIPWGVDSDQF
jgi:hypothetical protein